MTVGLVVLTFVICWLPFFVLALVRPLVLAVPGPAVGDSRVVLDVTDYYSLRKCSVVRQSWTGNGFVISGREKGKMKKIPFIGK